MRSENILSADILDLIFENRNKNYGAYMLRKHYNSRMVKALLYTFLMVAAAFSGTLFFKTERPKEIIITDPYVIKLLPEVIAEKPKAPTTMAQPKSAAKKMNTAQWVNTVLIVPNEADVSKLNKNLDSAVIGSTTTVNDSDGRQTIQGPESIEPGGEEGTSPEPAKVVDKETPRLTADVMPAFPGGMEALRKYLERNLENPEELENGTVISVKIRFVVGYDGKLKSFQTIEDGGEPFNNEVLRVLKRMPQWIPGKSNGEKVSVYYTIPVKFTAAE